MTATTARSIGCAACGGQFSISSPEPHATCPFCQHRQALPEALLRELREFREQFRPVQVRADEAAQHAASWKEFAAGPGSIGKRGILIFQLVVVGPIGLSILSKQLGWSFDLGGAVYGAYALLLAVGLVAVRLRRPAQRRPAPPSVVQANLGVQHMACPACGAQNAYDPRQAGTTCAHCRSALFPTAPVLGHSLDGARLAQRQALLAKYRAERAGTAKIAVEARRHGTFSATRSLPVVAAFVCLLLLLGGLTSEMGNGSIPDHPAMYAIWLALPLALGLVAWRAHGRTALRAGLEAELQSVAQRNAGRVSASVAEYVAWLDRHWAGPYPVQDIGAWFYAAQLSAGGYPVLVELNLERVHDDIATLNILLAAHLPSLGDADADASGAASPARQPFHEGLYQHGCSLELAPAGLLARMDSDRVKAARFDQNPEALGVIDDILSELTGVARALRAV